MKNIAKKFRARLSSIQVRSFLLNFCVGILVMIILVMLIYTFFQNKSREDINTITKSSLNKVSYMMESSTYSIKNFAYQLHNDNNFTQFVTSKERDILNEIKVTNTINNAVIFYPYIDSVFICNTDSVIMRKYCSSQYSIESDSEVFELISKNQNLKPVFRQVKNNYGGTVNLCTVIYKFTYSDNNKYSDALVINVNVDLLSKQVISDDPIFIIDSNRNVIMQKDENIFLRNLSQETYINRILTSGESYGSFDILIGKERFAVDYLKAKQSGYWIISLKSYNIISKELSKMRNYVIIICIFVLPLLYMGFFVISNRIFHPITEMVRSIKGNIKFMEGYSLNDGIDEIKFISSTLSKVIKHADDLEMKEKDNLFILRNNYFGILLTKKTNFTRTEIVEKFTEYDVPIDLEKSYFIIVLRIDHYQEVCKEHTGNARSLMLFSVGDIACELLKEEFSTCHFQIGEDHQVIIANVKESWDAKYKEIIVTKLETAQATVKQYLNIYITIGISNITIGSSYISDLYAEAFNYTNYRLFNGTSMVFNCEELESKENVSCEYEIGEILIALKHGDKKRYILLVEEMLKALRKCSYNSAFDKITQLIISISSISNEFKLNQKDIEKIDIVNVHNMLKIIESPEELKESLVKLFDTVYDIVSKINNTRIQDVIERTIEYINDNYTNPQISANYIANKFSITLQYFSTNFNECTGEGFPSYINRLRLEKAKDLILATDLDISEISEKVGYLSRTYFTSLFKNEYGISPSKYRLQR